LNPTIMPLRLLAVAGLSAALLWLVLLLPAGGWSRAVAVCAGTPLLVALSEALRRLWIEPESLPRRAGAAADELAVGFELQRRFLPAEKEVSFAGLHLAGRCLPARGVSGDTFDFGTLSDGRAMLLLADVAGKGIPAAILMAVFHSSFRSRLAMTADLAPILESLNHQIHGLSGPNRYVTAFCGLFDRKSGVVEYVNAGHLPPILCRAGRLEQLELGGFPLGMFDEVVYELGRARLVPGDLLVIYSDGVIEAVNKAGEEFGKERLDALIQANCDGSVSALRDLLFRELEAWNDDFVQEDDITILVVRREDDRPQASGS
jgi:serine phosphatase RsbU (regulator of sigma subunit)